MRISATFRAVAICAVLASPGTGWSDIGKYEITNVAITELPMPPEPQIKDSWAYDINSQGDIVGGMFAYDFSQAMSAFIHMDGQTYSLFPPGGWIESYHVVARSINDARLVVGFFEDTTTSQNPDPYRPFFYYPGVWMSPMTSFPVNNYGRDWESWAYAVNNNNHVVGRTRAIGYVPATAAGLCAERPTQWYHYTLYPGGFMCPSDPDNNGTIAGQGLPPAAYGVNDSDEIVGTDGGTTPYSMFLYKDGQLLAVPKPATMSENKKGIAASINKHGWVTGTFGYAAADNIAKGMLMTGVRAFVWNGTSSDPEMLPSLRYASSMQALDINDQKMVVGSSRRAWSSASGAPKAEVAYIWHPHFSTVQLPHLAAWNGIPMDCEASAINNRKSAGMVQVAGHCKNMNGLIRAVRWDLTIGIQFPVP